MPSSAAPLAHATPKAEANTSVCPRCGAGLRCGMVAGDAECWCVQLPHIMPVPVARDASATATADVSCYCPACLKQVTDERTPTAFAMMFPAIEPVADTALQAGLQHKIDHKTKPPGALGRLERLALQMGLVQRSDTLTLTAPQIVVFAADHGIANEGVSAYPQAVTVQMVGNMLAGGAAINVFARQHGFALHVVDAGVAADLAPHAQLLSHRIAPGTRNSSREAAMTTAQAEAALRGGMAIVKSLPGNVIAFGEMGIANTSAAALLFSRLAGVDIADATGRGTGIDDGQLSHKRSVLARALALHADAIEPLDALAALGGFEIAMMAGAMLQAASERRLVLVDGFIAGAAALVARALVPAVTDYCVFCHRSAEHGHSLLLDHLGAKPLLEMDLRLGEGTGALLAWPLLQSAAGFLNEMASFDSAGVSGKVETPGAPQP